MPYGSSWLAVSYALPRQDGLVQQTRIRISGIIKINKNTIWSENIMGKYEVWNTFAMILDTFRYDLYVCFILWWKHSTSLWGDGLIYVGRVPMLQISETIALNSRRSVGNVPNLKRLLAAATNSKSNVVKPQQQGSTCSKSQEADSQWYKC